MAKNLLSRRVHVSWHITAGCFGLIAGIALVPTGLELPAVLPIVLCIALLCVRMFRLRVVMLLLVCVLGMYIGAWRGGSEKHALAAYALHYNHPVHVAGNVSEDTTLGVSGDMRIRLSGVQIDGSDMPGTVWVSTKTQADIKRGDRITADGKLTVGFGTTSATMYRATIRRIERPNPGDLARRFRDWFAAAIRRALPEPHASLSVGYLVGQRSALPETLSAQLQVVGLTHAVVASGYNLTILVSFARRILAPYSKYSATLLAMCLVLAFVLITGFSPSMTRAALVAVCSLLAWYYGRTFHPIVLLLFVAALTAMWRPSYVWGDLGWYLSFSAFAGVIIVSPVIKAYFVGDKTLNMFKQTLLDTLAAQLCTMPIILFAFGHYATYALIANVLVLPLIPLAMLLICIAGLGSLVLPGFAAVFGFPARLVLSANLLVIDWVAGWPGAQGEVVFGVNWVVLSYGLMIASVAYMWKVTGYDPKRSA